MALRRRVFVFVFYKIDKRERNLAKSMLEHGKLTKTLMMKKQINMKDHLNYENQGFRTRSVHITIYNIYTIFRSSCFRINSEYRRKHNYRARFQSSLYGAKHSTRAKRR